MRHPCAVSPSRPKDAQLARWSGEGAGGLSVKTVFMVFCSEFCKNAGLVCDFFGREIVYNMLRLSLKSFHLSLRMNGKSGHSQTSVNMSTVTQKRQVTNMQRDE